MTKARYKLRIKNDDDDADDDDDDDDDDGNNNDDDDDDDEDHCNDDDLLYHSHPPFPSVRSATQSETSGSRANGTSSARSTPRAPRPACARASRDSTTTGANATLCWSPSLRAEGWASVSRTPSARRLRAASASATKDSSSTATSASRSR